VELKRLRYFVAVGELGSFTLAARQLGIAQPALSRHIRQLETECGMPLLWRNGRGAQLSDIGKIVCEHAKSLLDQVDRLESNLAAAKGAPAGNVILGMPPSVCIILVEALFQRVRREYPGIKLHISEAFSGDLRDWLIAGRLDIGVLYNPGRMPHLIGHHLLEEDMFLCSAAAECDASRPAISLADAIKVPLILPSRPHGLRILVDNVCSEAQVTPDIVLELDSMAAIKELVCRTDAATILPFCGVYHDVAKGHISARRIVSPTITRTLVIAETIRRPKTRATAAVVSCLREEVARLVAAGLWTDTEADRDSIIADSPIKHLSSRERATNT
jgi:LysR family transcriptional regulator, nitrogen assimilation regulatory protein